MCVCLCVCSHTIVHMHVWCGVRMFPAACLHVYMYIFAKAANLGTGGHVDCEDTLEDMARSVQEVGFASEGFQVALVFRERMIPRHLILACSPVISNV